MIADFRSHDLDTDEQRSEAMLALVRAVEGFNPWRGFRFSTYAYRAIARRLARFGSDTQRQGERFLSGVADSLPDPIDDTDSNSLDEMSWDRLQANLSDILDQLDKDLLQALAIRHDRG